MAEKWTGAAGWAFLLIGAGAVLAQAPAGQPDAAGSKPAAMVNGEPVSVADVDRITEMILKQKFKIQPATEEQRAQVRREVLDLLINDVLMRQFLRKHGPPVDDAEVNKHLADFGDGLQRQQPPRTFDEFCKDTNQTPMQVRATIAAMLQWLAFVKATVTEADVKRYYDETKDFFDQVAVRASHIVLRVDPKSSPGEREAARQKLAALRAEIAAGKLDFAEAAKKHSQCPSASSGGDIGYFSRKGMLEENFAKAAFSMQVGELSDIVTTDFGVHLIKVTERRPGQPSDYEKLQREAREVYVEELRQKILIDQRKAGQIEILLP